MSDSTEGADFIHRLRDLHDAELQVASELELEELLQTIADEARRLTGAQYSALGFFALEDGDSEVDGEGHAGSRRFSRFITSGLSDEERAGYGRPPRGMGLLGAVIEEGRPVRVDRIDDDPRSAGPPPGHFRPTSFLGVPVRIGDRVLGNLYLTNKLDGPAFHERDQVLLEMLAAQAAVAIDKAQLFEEREDLISRLERARGLRNRLSSYVNHDIRNALQGVALWSERLGRRLEAEGEGGEELQDMIQKIRRGSDHALRLVKDVLDLNKLEEGRLEIWPRRILVPDLVGAAVDAVLPMAHDEGVEVAVAEVPRDLSLVADPDRVHQIVVNLLSNAVKFSPEGARVAVEVGVRDDPDGGEGGWITLAVEDEGPGIHADDHERIFGFYEQLQSDPWREKGTGIGLTLSRHLAEIMGGRITLDSEPGEGARFVLWLPRGQVPEQREGWIG